MPNRLSLEGDLFPVQCFFNAVYDDQFVEVIGRLLRGIGHGSNEAHCTFPDDLDPGEEPFEGVMFSIFEEVVVLKHEEFLNYLREACRSYLATHPDDDDEINRLLTSPEANRYR